MVKGHSGFPGFEGFDAWIDVGRAKGTSCELVIAVDIHKDTREHYPREFFWLEFTAPNGQFMGWMRFDKQMALRQQAIFVATELRPADGPAPASKDVLLRLLERRPEGFEYAE